MGHFVLDATGRYDYSYVPAGPETTVEVANESHQEVKGYDKLGLFVKQPGGQPGGMAQAPTLKRVAVVPNVCVIY